MFIYICIYIYVYIYICLYIYIHMYYKHPRDHGHCELKGSQLLLVIPNESDTSDHFYFTGAVFGGTLGHSTHSAKA